MRSKLFSLLLLFLCFTSKANPLLEYSFSYSCALNNCKISEIDNEIKEAFSINDFRVLALHILEFIKSNLNDTCREPLIKDFRMLCGDLVSKEKVHEEEETDFYEYEYERRIFNLACVNVRIDSEETIKQKVRLWWEKYKTKCKCDSTTFDQPNGNILKFSISQSHPLFIEFLASNNADINFIDPADNRNVLDYLNDLIAKLKVNGSSKTTIQIYEKYRKNIISVGAKPSK